jgi:hypothetical protein
MLFSNVILKYTSLYKKNLHLQIKDMQMKDAYPFSVLCPSKFVSNKNNNF